MCETSRTKLWGESAVLQSTLQLIKTKCGDHSLHTVGDQEPAAEEDRRGTGKFLPN